MVGLVIIVAIVAIGQAFIKTAELAEVVLATLRINGEQKQLQGMVGGTVTINLLTTSIMRLRIAGSSIQENLSAALLFKKKIFYFF